MVVLINGSSSNGKESQHDWNEAVVQQKLVWPDAVKMHSSEAEAGARSDSSVKTASSKVKAAGAAG